MPFEFDLKDALAKVCNISLFLLEEKKNVAVTLGEELKPQPSW